MNNKIIYEEGDVILTDEKLDEITKRVYEQHKDETHYNDDGENDDYNFMRTEIEEELQYIGCDIEWVLNDGNGFIEDSLDEVV